MITKTVTYEDFDGAQQTETLWFNISKSKWIETELNGVDLPDGTHVDSYSAYLKSFVNGDGSITDVKGMMGAIKDLIGRAYGVRKGSKFEQTPEIAADFLDSQAYDQFFWDLVTDPKSASAFIEGLVPKEILAQAQADTVGVKVNVPVETVATAQPLVPAALHLPTTDGNAAVPAAFATSNSVPVTHREGHRHNRPVVPQPEVSSAQTQQPY